MNFTKTCFGCGQVKEKLGQCSNCENVYYCSEKCQKDHWQIHKYLCVKPKQKVEKKETVGFKEERNSYFVAKKFDNGLEILSTIDHSETTSLQGGITFITSIFNGTQDTISLDLLSCCQIVFQDLLLKPKVKKTQKEEEDEILQTMITQLNDTENPKVVNKNGKVCIELVEKVEIKTKEYITIEQTFPVELEYNYESKFLQECKFFYVFYNDKKLELEFDQKEIETFYKDFQPGKILRFEKNKKYPAWKKISLGVEKKELPSEEDWYKFE